MKLSWYIIILLTVSINNKAIAQQFRNGSLEPGPSSVAVPCDDNYDAQINTMGYIWKTIDLPAKMYMAQDTCTTGAAKDGHYFLGLYYGSTILSGNRIILELNSVMISGNTYKFGFWYKGALPQIGTGASMEYGWTDSISSGHDTTAGFIDSIGHDIQWRKYVASITPHINTKYIWIGALPRFSPDSGIVYIDKFVMNDSTYSDTAVADTTSIVNEVLVQNRHMGVYPNPFKAITTLSIGNTVALPYSYTVYDVAGRVMMEKDGINDRKVPIGRSGLINGMYFLKVTDRNKNTYMTRLVAE